MKKTILVSTMLTLLSLSFLVNNVSIAQEDTPFSSIQLPVSGYTSGIVYDNVENLYLILNQENALLKFNTNTRESTVYSLLPASSPNMITIDSNGNIWISLVINKVAMFNPKTEEFTYYDLLEEGLDSNTHGAGIKFYNGYIWLLTHYLIHKIDFNTGADLEIVKLGGIEQIGDYSVTFVCISLAEDNEFFWISLYDIHNYLQWDIYFGRLIKFNTLDSSYEIALERIPNPYGVAVLDNYVYVSNFVTSLPEAGYYPNVTITRYDKTTGENLTIETGKVVSELSGHGTVEIYVESSGKKVWWTDRSCISLIVPQCVYHVGYLDFTVPTIVEGDVTTQDIEPNIVIYQVADASYPNCFTEGLGMLWFTANDVSYSNSYFMNLSKETIMNSLAEEENASFAVTDVSYGDINTDGVVDIFDVVLIATAFGSNYGETSYKLVADRNIDNIVDIFDLVRVALHFGETI